MQIIAWPHSFIQCPMVVCSLWMGVIPACVILCSLVISNQNPAVSMMGWCWLRHALCTNPIEAIVAPLAHSKRTHCGWWAPHPLLKRTLCASQIGFPCSRMKGKKCNSDIVPHNQCVSQPLSPSSTPGHLSHSSQVWGQSRPHFVQWIAWKGTGEFWDWAILWLDPSRSLGEGNNLCVPSFLPSEWFCEGVHRSRRLRRQREGTGRRNKEKVLYCVLGWSSPSPRWVTCKSLLRNKRSPWSRLTIVNLSLFPPNFRVHLSNF